MKMAPPSKNSKGHTCSYYWVLYNKSARIVWWRMGVVYCCLLPDAVHPTCFLPASFPPLCPPAYESSIYRRGRKRKNHVGIAEIKFKTMQYVSATAIVVLFDEASPPKQACNMGRSYTFAFYYPSIQIT